MKQEIDPKLYSLMQEGTLRYLFEISRYDCIMLFVSAEGCSESMLHSTLVGNGGPVVTKWAHGAEYRDITQSSMCKYSDINHGEKCIYRHEDPTHRCNLRDMDHTLKCEYNVADGSVKCKYTKTDPAAKCKYKEVNKGKHSNVKCKYSKVYCDDHYFESGEDKEIAYIEDDGFV